MLLRSGTKQTLRFAHPEDGEPSVSATAELRVDIASGHLLPCDVVVDTSLRKAFGTSSDVGVLLNNADWRKIMVHSWAKGSKQAMSRSRSSGDSADLQTAQLTSAHRCSRWKGTSGGAYCTVLELPVQQRRPGPTCQYQSDRECVACGGERFRQEHKHSREWRYSQTRRLYWVRQKDLQAGLIEDCPGQQ